MEQLLNLAVSSKQCLKVGNISPNLTIFDQIWAILGGKINCQEYHCENRGLLLNKKKIDECCDILRKK